MITLLNSELLADGAFISNFVFVLYFVFNGCNLLYLFARFFIVIGHNLTLGAKPLFS